MRQAARVGAAAAGAALGAVLTKQLAAKRQSAAIIELSNLLVGLGDPTALTRDMVAGVEAKYGCALPATCPEELKAIYGTFVEAAVPPGDAPLSGREQVLIQVGAVCGCCRWLEILCGQTGWARGCERVQAARRRLAPAALASGPAGPPACL